MRRTSLPAKHAPCYRMHGMYSGRIRSPAHTPAHTVCKSRLGQCSQLLDAHMHSRQRACLASSARSCAKAAAQRCSAAASASARASARACCTWAESSARSAAQKHNMKRQALASTTPCPMLPKAEDVQRSHSRSIAYTCCRTKPRRCSLLQHMHKKLLTCLSSSVRSSASAAARRSSAAASAARASARAWCT